MAFLTIFFALPLFLHGAFGEMVCEDLPVEKCSFAIATTGNRCLLETSAKENDVEVRKGSTTTLHCKTSQAIATIMNEYIETDSCIRACGVVRKTVGISSDNLFDSRFTKKLCSSPCLNHCPNIFDLYYNLALGEGLYLPELCTKMQGGSRRELGQNVVADPPSPHSVAFEESLFDAADSPVSFEALIAGAPVSFEDLIAEAPAPI